MTFSFLTEQKIQYLCSVRTFYIAVAALSLLCASCVNQRSKKVESSPAAYTLEIPNPPVMMDPAGQRDFLCRHFWDNMDFSDTSIPERIDSTAFRNLFVNYAALLQEQPDGGVAQMTALMEKASQNAPMLALFSGIGRMMFFDPNSPLRNDDLYLTVLNAISSSSLVDDESREEAAWTAELVSRNRPGTPAEDFSYLTIQNRPGSLYGIKAPYTLVFFSNPGCNMCREIREKMAASSLITDLVRKRKLAVIALYPDEDIELWQSYKDEIPSDWINARDPGSTLHASGLYDLKAIPSLYLLDSDKTVLLKDCTDVRLIEAALAAEG